MKKETGIAVFLGIMAGVAIAVFVIIGTRQTKPSGEIIEGTITPSISSISQETSPLVVTTPENESFVKSDSIKIAGTTQKNALVVIQSPVDEEVFTSKGTSFESSIDLAPGENMVKITTYTSKNITSKSLIIYSVDAS